jgi:hypothetical protein
MRPNLRRPDRDGQCSGRTSNGTYKLLILGRYFVIDVFPICLLQAGTTKRYMFAEQGLAKSLFFRIAE